MPRKLLYGKKYTKTAKFYLKNVLLILVKSSMKYIITIPKDIMNIII